MAPFIALLGSFAIFRLLGFAGVSTLDDWQTPLRAALAVMFAVTGIPHFLPNWRKDLAAMIPPSFPRPALLVTITGVLELTGAIGLLIPPTAPLAATCLALLMLAMFPANISAARRTLTLNNRPVTPLPLRTLLQLLFITAAVGAAL